MVSGAACRASAYNAANAEAGGSVMTEWRGAVAQFGAYAVLPMSNGAFENNSLVATFRDDGALTRFTYGVTRPSGLGGAQALEDATNQLQELQTNLLKDRTSQLQSINENLKQQLEIDAKQQQLNEARRAAEAKRKAEQNTQPNAGGSSTAP
jgi:hypothetical protein